MDGVSPGAGPPFPGGIGVSHLRVSDTVAPAGLAGGTPHLHTVCTEAYAVIAGGGKVQTLTMAGFEETPLEPGAFVWFTPGTIHRLVNDGDLEILVLMANAGLPEAGDMVITFEPDVVADAERYAAAAALPEDDRTTSGPGDAARLRRDAAVPEFLRLAESIGTGDTTELELFHDAAAAIVRPKLRDWVEIWREGPLAAVEATGVQLTALATGDATHLADATVTSIPPPEGARRMGCCGTLGTHVLR